MYVDETGVLNLGWIVIDLATCELCGYSWTAVCPEDAEQLECPKCGNFGFTIDKEEKE